jgi:membrane protein YdfJ
MGTFLYRLGSWASRRPIRVMIVSVAALMIAVALSFGMGANFEGDMSIPGTKSEQALKVLEKYFPSDEGDKATMELVFKAPLEETLESEFASRAIRALLEEIRKDPEVEIVASPYETGAMSEDKRLGSAQITYRMALAAIPDDSKELVFDKLAEAREAGMQAELSGGFESEFEVGGISELIGIVVAYLILAVTFASLLAAGLPILTSLLGLGIGVMSIMIVSNVVDMSSVSLTLAVMLGLAVGIDYALFIIYRFRQQLAQGFGRTESIAQANATAGSAVVFAGMTVIVALVGLSVVGIPFLTTMGLAAAFSILVAIIVAIVLVPAVLGLMGHRLQPAARTRRNVPSGSAKQRSNAWVSLIIRHPLLVTVLGALLLIAISIPALHMNIGLPDNGTRSVETTERRAYDLLTEWHGAGVHGPLIVVAQAGYHVEEPQAAIAKATEGLSGLTNVANVSPLIPSESERVAMITVIPDTGPSHAKTKDLVNQIREQGEELQEANGVQLMVTGNTAVDIDISDKLRRALPIFLVFVVGLAFVILLIAFRSILVPLTAVLGYLLTIAATLGFLVFVVQDGYMSELFGIPEPGPVLNYMPILAAGILFGLAMDYEMFLVSRMREEYTNTGDAQGAVLAGLRGSGAVVTSAGLIMIAVFASFIFVSDPIIKSMGIALTFGILFDAFIVRLAIVPAVMKLLGRSAWYLPKRLDRILPTIDVEGEKVMKHVHEGEGKHAAARVGTMETVHD